MRIIAMFNLKPGVGRAAYETWARERDLPTVGALPSVDGFEVLRSTGVLFSDAAPPFDYIEVIDISGIDDFLTDAGGDAVGTLAREMGQFTDGATFITTERL